MAHPLALGNVVEVVIPVAHTLPLASRAMEFGDSSTIPGGKVNVQAAVPAGLSFSIVPPPMARYVSPAASRVIALTVAGKEIGAKAKPAPPALILATNPLLVSLLYRRNASPAGSTAIRAEPARKH